MKPRTRKAAPSAAELRNRVAVSPEEGARLLGIDRSTFYRHIMPYVRSGEIAALHIGARRLILVASLLAWSERQAGRAA